MNPWEFMPAEAMLVRLCKTLMDNGVDKDTAVIGAQEVYKTLLSWTQEAENFDRWNAELG